MKSQPISVFESYLQYGNATPPLGALRRYAEAIVPDAGARSVILAEVYIDTATKEPERYNIHFSKARELLGEVISHTEYLQAEGYERAAILASETAVTAGLRLIDINNYHTWVANGATDNNYPRMVDAMRNITQLTLSIAAEDRLREYFPVLLASRMRHRKSDNHSGIAAGRMALAREDRRPLCAPGINPRWDCALFSPDEAIDFTKPTQKVQVKVGKKRQGGKFAQAGVACVSLRQCGLDDTFDVLDRCFDELGFPMLYDGEPLSSRELDIRTAKMLNALDRG
jgi:hypothetical protein